MNFYPLFFELYTHPIRHVFLELLLNKKTFYFSKTALRAGN